MENQIVRGPCIGMLYELYVLLSGLCPREGVLNPPLFVCAPYDPSGMHIIIHRRKLLKPLSPNFYISGTSSSSSSTQFWAQFCRHFIILQGVLQKFYEMFVNFVEFEDFTKIFRYIFKIIILWKK